MRRSLKEWTAIEKRFRARMTAYPVLRGKACDKTERYKREFLCFFIHFVIAYGYFSCDKGKKLLDFFWMMSTSFGTDEALTSTRWAYA